jgi:hypothetical protein
MRPFLLLAIFCLLSFSANAAEPGFKMESLFLYQPDEVLRERVSDVEDLAKYTKSLESVCIQFFAKEAHPEALRLVVAVKPGKQSRVWFISDSRKNMKTLAPLRAKLEKVVPFEARGSVAFAVNGSVAGGKNPPFGENGPPIPAEWEDAAKNKKGSVLVPDGFLALVWPDVPGAAPKALLPPKGFENQVLEPTGGRIWRPKGWHYAEGHAGPKYMWTISKEAPEKGYTTGVRIQSFTGLKENTGQTARQFVESFIEQKKKTADRVIKSCEPKDMEHFVRVCLEVEEGPHHILYSLFWGANDLDIAVVAISGTTKELWGDYQETFDRMSAFELIDMKRFSSGGKKGGK